MFSIFGLGLFYNEVLLDNVIVNTYENEEMAFIGQRNGEPLKWRQFDEISKDTISKIKYTALFQASLQRILTVSSDVQNALTAGTDMAILSLQE